MVFNGWKHTDSNRNRDEKSIFCDGMKLSDWIKCVAITKGSFSSEREMKFFQISKSEKKKIFQKTILSLKFKFPANNSKVLLAGNINFKLRIVF